FFLRIKSNDPGPGIIAATAALERRLGFENARQTFGALEVAPHPEYALGVAGEKTAHASSSFKTQVSFVPPPWLELTTIEPLRSATRVRPPGKSHVSSPVIAKGRRST